jgi:hypothetical protein
MERESEKSTIKDSLLEEVSSPNKSLGGFAKCYRGIDLSSKEEVAIKVVEKTTLARSRAKQKVTLEKCS